MKNKTRENQTSVQLQILSKIVDPSKNGYTYTTYTAPYPNLVQSFQ